MTTHSPLPWTRYVSIGSWFVQDANGETITLFSRQKDLHSEPLPGVRQITTVSRPHADANCQLFFAAPQMLDVLKRVEFWLGTAEEGKAMQVVVRDAITAATEGKDGTIAAAERQAERDKAIHDAFGVVPPNEGDLP